MQMSKINFSQIPDSLLVPGQYQEVDNSLAGTRTEIKRILLVGPFLATGTAKNGVIERITSTIKAGEKFGYGSILSVMCEQFLSVNKNDELYALPITDNGTAYSKTYKIALTEANQTGNIKITVNTNEINISVVKEDTAETIAGKIAASVNTMFNFFMNAVSGESANEDATWNITFNALNKGDYGIILNIESDNSKITFAEGSKTDAADSPVSDWKVYFDAIGETRYNYIINAFNDENTLKKFAEELESRYSATRQIGGRMFAYLKGEIGNTSENDSIVGKASKVNSPHICFIPIVQTSSSINTNEFPIIFLTKIAAAAITELINDPSANTLGLEVAGITTNKSLLFEERQNLLTGGVATYNTDAQGNILIERLVTSYTTNSEGARDTSYLDIQIVETIDAIRTYINNEAKTRFKGWKLSSTNEDFGAGAKVMNAEVWTSFLCELYQSVFMEERSWTQDFQSYKESITAQVKSGTKTWLEYVHKPILIGQFYIGAGLNQFK